MPGQQLLPLFYAQLLYARAQAGFTDEPVSNRILIVPERINVNDGQEVPYGLFCSLVRQPQCRKRDMLCEATSPW